MTYDEELLKILTKKSFKTFWHCLDYLILAGYTPMDAFGVTMKHFGEDKIFESVAIARYEEPAGLRHDVIDINGQRMVIDPVSNLPVHAKHLSKLTIALVDETNQHLSGLYGTYRKWFNEGRFKKPQYEIESTCEIIQIRDLGVFILDYLNDVSLRLFGYKMIKLEIYENTGGGGMSSHAEGSVQANINHTMTRIGTAINSLHHLSETYIDREEELRRGRRL